MSVRPFILNARRLSFIDTTSAAATTLAAGLALLAGSPALAQTNVGGPIFGDTTWDVAGSPYIVTSSVLVGADATLTINAGVEVRINEGLGVSIGSGGFGAGTLVARGTPVDPIIFTSNVGAPAIPAPGDWNAITFADEAVDAAFDGTGGPYLSGSVLQHCVLEFAGGGGIGSGSISIEDSRPWIASIEVRDSARAGVFASMASAPPLRIESSTFRRCAGMQTGGGVHISGGTGHRLLQSTFIDCTGSSGAGASITAPSSTVSSCTFTDNDAAGNGGGLFISSVSGIVTGNSFTGNDGSAGGGMIIQSSNSALVEDNEFFSNTASSGGGLYVNGGSSLTIVGNTMSDNTASSTGGGAFFQSGNSEVRENTIDDNQTLNGEAGGAYVNMSNVVFENNSVSGNTAGSNGGGMRLLSSGGNFQGNQFNDNIAGSGRGGGAYISGNSNSFTGDEFTGNFAGTQGGGLDVTGSSVTLNTATIAFNEATSLGGGMHWSGTGGSIAGNESAYCVVADNVADGGPAIWYAAANGNDLAAQSVCWGVRDGGTITAQVHDFFDDSSLGLVLFFPFIDDPSCSGSPCPADLDGTGSVDFEDLLVVLSNYGSGAGGDIDGDDVTDFNDVLAALSNFGPCP